MRVPRQTDLPGGLLILALFVCCEAVPGTPTRRSVVPRIVAGTSPAAASTALASVAPEFDYQTRDSSTRVRRVIAKAEHLAKGANPRFGVTLRPAGRTPP